MTADGDNRNAVDLQTLDLKRPLLIAEVGGNHDGEVARAYELGRLAAEQGADVVKYQTYSPDAIVNKRLDPERHAHFARLGLPAAEWRNLAEYVRERGAEWMTSLWDPDLLDEVTQLQPAFKIGSGDLSNLPLLDRIARTGKPMILSTAMASLADVQCAVGFLVGRDPNLLTDHRLGLLQCSALYDEPTAEHMHLRVMSTLRAAFPGAVVGYSDHHAGMAAARAALALGAMILEVHFTDDRSRPMRDHKFSVLPNELEELRDLCERMPRLLGSERKEVSEVEAGLAKEFRRGVYFAHDVEAGHTVTHGDLVTLRPEEGISAWHYYELLGCRVSRRVRSLEPLQPEFFSEPTVSFRTYG